MEDYSSSGELIHILINKVAKGSNLLLIIGPTADGRTPLIMKQRLADMSNWLKVNGGAIYETRKWYDAPAITPISTTYFTKKSKDLYMMVTVWEDEPIVVEGINTAEEISMLGYIGKMKFTVLKNKLIITPPRITPANNPYQYSWAFKVKNCFR